MTAVLPWIFLSNSNSPMEPTHSQNARLGKDTNPATYPSQLTHSFLDPFMYCFHKSYQMPLLCFRHSLRWVSDSYEIGVTSPFSINMPQIHRISLVKQPHIAISHVQGRWGFTRRSWLLCLSERFLAGTKDTIFLFKQLLAEFKKKNKKQKNLQSE